MYKKKKCDKIFGLVYSNLTILRCDIGSIFGPDLPHVSSSLPSKQSTFLSHFCLLLMHSRDPQVNCSAEQGAQSNSSISPIEQSRSPLQRLSMDRHSPDSQRSSFRGQYAIFKMEKGIYISKSGIIHKEFYHKQTKLAVKSCKNEN